MSVRIRKSWQALIIALPLAFVGGQMPAMAASADAPPAAPPAPAAQATPGTPDNGQPAASSSAKPVDPQAQVVQGSGTPNSPTLGVPALDLKEDIAEVCAGAPILPFQIGSASNLKDLLVKLHLMDALTEVCAVEDTLGKLIEKQTGPNGLLDLDALLH